MTRGERASEAVASKTAAPVAYLRLCALFNVIIQSYRLPLSKLYTRSLQDSKEVYPFNHAKNAIFDILLHDVHNDMPPERLWLIN